VTRGLEVKKDRETFAAFAEHLIEPRWVSPTAQALLDAALDYMLGDRESLDDLRDEISALLKRVEQLFLSLDSNLNFRLEPFDETAEAPVPAQDNGARELDLRGIACPMNFVRAKIQLEQLENGEVLHILLDDGEPVRNVPASFAEQGQEVLSVTGEGPHFRVSVRKVL
jgi:sulfite reductase (ferredoxin)